MTRRQGIPNHSPMLSHKTSSTRLSSCTPEITKKPVIPSHPTLQGDVSMPTSKQGEFGLKLKADDRRWRRTSPDMKDPGRPTLPDRTISGVLIEYTARFLGSLISGFEFIVRKKGSYFAVFHLRLRY